MPVLHRVTFPASDAYKLNLTLAEPAVKVIADAEGYLGAWYGLQNEVEGAELGHLVTAWETYEHHKKVVDGPGYADIMAGVKPALKGPLDSHHIKVTMDHIPALSAPTTEFVSVTLKEGKDMAELLKVSERMINHLNGAKGAFPPIVFGTSIEEPTKIILVIGWGSRQIHMDAISVEPFTSTMGEIAQLADITFSHTDMTKYSK
ncbi:hypothetical protein C8J56DRAFT_911195 [Mycena floridula]|nr:hypothetical protein C8J56DRAFT_911195 [Mycena floridula]